MSRKKKKNRKTRRYEIDVSALVYYNTVRIWNTQKNRRYLINEFFYVVSKAPNHED